jgi:hypothetical protein
MIGHDDLFSRSVIPPFLMALGCPREQEAVVPKHRDHLIRG